MAAPASTVLDDLSAHLQKVQEDPSTPLDQELLEKCELYTTTPEYRNHAWKNTQPLFFQLAQLLPTLQQDPAPMNHFILKLTAPYTFDHVKDIDFGPGLDLAASPFHGLTLSLIEKAAASDIDADKLAAWPDVIKAVVRLWLCTEDAGIATQAANLLLALLKVSKSVPDGINGDGLPAHGRGPMWRRIFHDRGVYDLFYVFCSLNALPSGEPQLSKRAKSLSQARLLEWLPKVGTLDWDTVASSQHAEIEKAVGLADGQGLVHFAARKMVEKDDILMHMALLNFYTDLISTIRDPIGATLGERSWSLQFLMDQGIHDEVIELFTTDEPSIEQSLLGSRIADYVAVYVSTYPGVFEHSRDLNLIRKRLERTLYDLEPTDLHVLASMPRSSLIPRDGEKISWEECLILSIPLTRTTPDALKTLATIFHGPLPQEVTFPPSSGTVAEYLSMRQETEQFYARALFALYKHHHPGFFVDILKHAETIALKETALAALVLLRAIITARWSVDPPSDLPLSSADIHLRRLLIFPKSGVEIALTPSLSGRVLPYLLGPATSFSNLVGGLGDAESAAYQVAVAKFEVLKALANRLGEVQGRHEVESMIRRRVAQGVWGEGGSAGSRIGTLEG